jgi:response regulator of citrate/malate metabolism
MKGKKTTKELILEAIKNSDPPYVTFQDIAKSANISRVTVSKYMQILEAEGKIRATKTVGTAKLYEAV